MGLDLSEFLSPVSDAKPCGDDLEFEYFDFTQSAEARLSAGFVKASGELIFERGDPSSGIVLEPVDLNGQVAKIRVIMENTRDLRLLALLVQFGSLCLSLDHVAAGLNLMRGLTERFWDDVHPRPEDDGDLTMRKIAVEAVDDRLRVSLPLTYLPLARSKSLGTITYRSYEIASKPELKREKETAVPLPTLLDALRSPECSDELLKTVSTLDQCLADLKALKQVFYDRTDYSVAPDFTNVVGTIEAITGTMRRELPELFGAPPAEDGARSTSEGAAVAETGASSADGATATLVSVAPTPLPAGESSVAVSSHDEARGLLLDIETYFADHEPSSPALLLVRQARRLFGRPLVEVLEVLVPGRLDAARIRLEGSSGFALHIDQLRHLSATPSPGPSAPDGEPPRTGIGTRAQAHASMMGVERFLAAAEPSSPVPLLLSKARLLMSKPFSEMIVDILGPPPENSK